MRQAPAPKHKKIVHDCMNKLLVAPCTHSMHLDAQQKINKFLHYIFIGMAIDKFSFQKFQK